MIESTEWDSLGNTAVRRRPVAGNNEIEDLTDQLEPEPTDGVEAEWYASAEESFDTAPVVLEKSGIKQGTFLASMLATATVAATIVCLVFKFGGGTAAASAVAAPVVAAAATLAPPRVETPSAAAPTPAPVTASPQQTRHKPARVVRSSRKRHGVATSSHWAAGFAQ